MRIWFDTEFIEDGYQIDLVSIGMVSEQGQELYLVHAYADYRKASPWFHEHVEPIARKESLQWSKEVIRERVHAFCGPTPEFWGYYADYDWVVLCQLFGSMIRLPTTWPQYCYDLRQALDMLGLRQVRQPDDAPHHALLDAQWVAKTWKQWIEPHPHRLAQASAPEPAT